MPGLRGESAEPPNFTTSDVDTSNMVICGLVVNEEITGYDDISHRIRETAMAEEIDWQGRVKGILKAELKRRNLGYRELAERLERFGIHENERNIANKVSRGGFSAVFFVQCLDAIGAKEVRLD